MDRIKTIKEQIEVMKACSEGKTIQQYSKYIKGWFDLEIDDRLYEPAFNWEDKDYRIKPEIKKRPMTFEEIKKYWKEHRTEIFYYQNECFMINGFETLQDDNFLEKNFIYFNDSCLEYDTFIEYVTKEDGSKFEVEE